MCYFTKIRNLMNITTFHFFIYFLMYNVQSKRLHTSVIQGHNGSTTIGIVYLKTLRVVH